MKSIFKPNTLEECVRSDEVSETLYRWSDIANWVGIISAVLILLGGIFQVDKFGPIVLAGSIISAIIAYGTCVSERFLLKALASIVESNCIQARASLYMAFADKMNESELPEELRF